MGCVVDDAHRHEQRRLEQAVGEEQGGAGEGRLLPTGTEEGDEEPELTHGPVGEQQLDVVLAEGRQAAHEHRGNADADHDRAPPDDDRRERRCEAGDEVDACLHHRG